MSSNDELDEQLKKASKQKELTDAQKAIAENQKAIAEAQKGTIEASFPKGATKPLEGEITTSEKFGYIAKLVAYESMKRKALQIADDIKKILNKNDKVLLVNDLDLASSDIPLIQVESILTLFTKNMNAQIETNKNFLKESKEIIAEALPLAAAVLAPMIIPGIISSVADIVGYFQVNYDVKGQDFTLDNQAILSIVAGKIKEKEIQVYIYNFNLVDESEILSSFNQTLSLKQDLDRTIDRIRFEIVKKKNDEIKITQDKIQELKKRLGELKDSDKDKKNILVQLKEYNESFVKANDLLDKANAHIINSESLSKAFSIFADSATKTTDEKTLPLLLKAALRKHIKTLKITHLLNLKIVSSGGEAITMKRRFFFGKANAAFIGGSVVSYILANTSGLIIAADTVTGLARLNYQLSGEGAPDFKEVSLLNHQPR